MEEISVNEALEKSYKFSDYNAVVTINEDAEKEKDKKPILIKDIIYTKGIKTTMGSKVFFNYIPREDARVITLLKRNGYTIVGKTNTHEFASGVTNTSSVFGPSRNPINKELITGGSSGGSAAAVKLKITDVALGTDTAGSIRIPASLCGVIGFRPTHGLISVKGVFPLAPTFDDVGIMSNNVEKLKEVFYILSEKKIKKYDINNLKKVKFALPEGFYSANESIENKFKDFISNLEYEIIDINNLKSAINAFVTIRYSEASWIHEKMRDKFDQYFPDVRRLIEKGFNYYAFEYLNSLKTAKIVRRRLLMILKKYDFIILPTTPIIAPKIEDVIGKEDGEIRSILTSNTWLSSLVGFPSISLPLLNINGYPAGVQLIGKPYEDDKLLEVSKLLQK
ncbi:amidase, Asp-tRNAAsn/Glu-tRNAGln amidotransferase A subunit [Caldisphaera lagunensis DSM 15908]|uniref:Amidase, Asp-tRNAAsn/Glu-tRNAGln amidotransferase A subunit n=1 Tax=Caldisphaera lagunensis (strain DSM 15908 / JCM 11604 / ANMR 0165 / IC-154) TaxID=1056495 RepID=L0A9Z4_CALLD|nr:amidase [Caldisphaera lagunensis]AFZ69875.1 amidase, Asp-tRNAAsn/Glu-tRNAGln amidotransferase A subunit [Caldisphaera lagunensis DSM 15908]